MKLHGMKLDHYRRRRLRRVVLLGLAAVSLSGCEGAALTMFGVGTSTGVQHTLSGITYRTFTAPSAKVKNAALVALGRMAIKVDKIGKPEGAAKSSSDEMILAKAVDRDIEVDLQALSPNTTRMRAVAKQGLFYDSATAYEIINQTEKVLGS